MRVDNSRMRLTIACMLTGAGAASAQDAAAPAAEPEVYLETVPATTVPLKMVKIEGDEALGIKPFWIAQTETTWDHYDPFVYRLDLPGGDPNAEAESRPSKPYVPPDRGFGHAGYPSMGQTVHAAEMYCKWLSEKTGHTYRLPTEKEWMWACLAGDLDDEDGFGIGDADSPKGSAWYADNADWTTHPVAKRAANPWGLFDMHGNIAEWVTVKGADGSESHVAKGGSFLDEREQLRASEQLKQDGTWNSSDPQIPKSRWWLADASWVGFRVVCDDIEVDETP